MWSFAISSAAVWSRWEKTVRQGDAAQHRQRQCKSGPHPLTHRARLRCQKHRVGLVIRTIGIIRARAKIGLANLTYNLFHSGSQII